MGNLIEDYFISPIFERTGYNAVNTLTYAAIALISLYIIWRLLKKKDFDFSGKDFLHGTAAFVLFGATSRVVTDLWDAGFIAEAAKTNAIYSALYSTKIFEYGYLTVTPGIYILTAIFFLSSIAMSMIMKNGRFPLYAGLALWLPCALLILPFISHLYFGLLVLLLAGIGSYFSFWLLSKYGGEKPKLHEKLAIAGQALDGAATYIVIDVFSKEAGKGYFEQHVLSAGIGTATPLGFGLFFLLKIALASLIVHFLRKEKMDWNDKALVLIVVAIMGFAPGLRDLLRMLAGT